MGFLSFVYRQLTFKIPQLPPHLNLKDKTILITGSNSGIGLEAARYCVELEAKLLILAVREYPKTFSTLVPSTDETPRHGIKRRKCKSRYPEKHTLIRNTNRGMGVGDGVR